MAAGLLRFWSEVLRQVYTDRWLYLSLALYVVTTGLLAFGIGVGDRFAPFLYLNGWTAGAAVVLVPSITVCTAVNGAIARPQSPLAGWGEELGGIVHPRLVAGLLLFPAVAIFYSCFTSTKNLLPEIFAYRWDVPLADIDRALHGGYDPVNVLVEVLGRRPTAALDFVYTRLWFGVLLGVSAWAATSSRHEHLRHRFFVTYLLCWVLIGNVLAGIFLSGGPCYYGEFTGDSLRFAGLRESLEGTATVFYRDYLWRLFAHRKVWLGTGISAFPSMHLSVSTLVALFLASIGRGWGALGALFTLLVLVGSVRLGWHYAIDGYASILITIALWYAVPLIWRGSR